MEQQPTYTYIARSIESLWDFIDSDFSRTFPCEVYCSFNSGEMILHDLVRIRRKTVIAEVRFLDKKRWQRDSNDALTATDSKCHFRLTNESAAANKAPAASLPFTAESV
ncbi:hypothetical protein [Vibrio sp.]|uniref:hypothetical protein n=1 Tax=Vibrio sp. TaxID=678 RepID=UPI003D0DD9E0